MASLRLTIPDETMAELQRLAKTTGTSVAVSARMVLGFGFIAVDALTGPAEVDKP